MIKRFFKGLLGIFFIAAGTAHFFAPAYYLKIMPPYIPFHLFLVYLSGAYEILLGVGVLIPKTSRLAGWGLILLLLAVFPANLYMALHPDLFPQIPKWSLYARLPFQGVFILWVYLDAIRKNVPKPRYGILVKSDREI